MLIFAIFNEVYYTGNVMIDSRMPHRKSTRMKDYDYALNGAYFVTICIYDRKPILSEIKCTDGETLQVVYTEIGNEIEKSIIFINEQYNTVNILKKVIMPNHIHMIVLLHALSPCDTKAEMTLQTVIGQFKSFTTKRFNEIRKSKYEMLWQRSFYDRVIRNEQEYLEVWKYIDENPINWELDEYNGMRYK